MSRLTEALTVEINDRPFLGLLAILVLLVHGWTMILLLQPAKQTEPEKPIKIMEVALVTEPIPKKEEEPPAPPKPMPAKQVPVKKKAVVPPIKKKAPVVPKQVEPKIKEQKVGEDLIAPVKASPAESVQKPQLSAPTSQPSANSKPVVKAGKGINSGSVLLTKVKPNYPMRAASRHIEGWVKIGITISPAGTVTRASVVGASPTGIFDEAALNTIKKWKFKPKMVNGIAVSEDAVQVVRFTLSD
jgi:periplasmic protein TonB